jgi:hypothetical protein
MNAKNGSGANWTSFSSETFEQAVLDKLKELQPDDIFPENDQGGNVVRLSPGTRRRRTNCGSSATQIDDDPKLLRSLKPTLLRLEAEYEQLAGELANAQREAASPLAEAWGEFRTVAQVAKGAPDDVRQRCRSAIRRLLDGVTVVFTGGKMVRKAAVRVQFRSGLHRDYLIVYQARNGTRKNPPPPIVISPPTAWHSVCGEFDLRNPAHAKQVEKLLNEIDVEALSMPTPTADPERLVPLNDRHR